MNSPILGFVDADLEVLLNSYPLSETRFIPRTGEIVLLPGEKGGGAGSYDVVSVQYEFLAEDAVVDSPSPAALAGVTVRVRARSKKQRTRSQEAAEISELGEGP